MNDWDKLLVALIVLALVAVVLASGQGSSAITQIGSAIATLVNNILGAKTNG